MRRALTIAAITFGWWLFGPTEAPTADPAPLPVHSGRYADGRAVEVVGDPVTATRVAVLIPGVETTAANFDAGLGGQQRRAPAWQARRLHAELRALDPTTSVAVVAWLGYDPPEGIGRAAIRADRAAAGAVALRGFVAQLGPARHVTVIGHSYGSLVAGLAAPHLDRRVTDIVALGSPGMGVDRAADLRTTARVWAGTGASDWTRRIPGVRIGGAGHGTRPAERSFGALALPVDGVEGHDGYYASDTTLRALAEIVLGRR